MFFQRCGIQARNDRSFLEEGAMNRRSIGRTAALPLALQAARADRRVSPSYAPRLGFGARQQSASGLRPVARPSRAIGAAPVRRKVCTIDDRQSGVVVRPQVLQYLTGRQP
jgi:hypothetical protein